MNQKEVLQKKVIGAEKAIEKMLEEIEAAVVRSKKQGMEMFEFDSGYQGALYEAVSAAYKYRRMLLDLIEKNK